MGILSRILGTETRVAARIEPRVAVPVVVKNDAMHPMQWGQSSLFGALGGMGVSNTGIAVTPYTALQVPTVSACIRCLSDDLAKLPLVVRRRLPGGGWEIDLNHALNKVLRDPNRFMTAMDLKAYIVTSYCLRGNAYVAIRRDGNGRPSKLIPLSPDRVSVLLSPDGHLFYHMSHPLLGTEGLVLHQDDVMHIRGMSLDGYTGISPLATGAEAIGLALATQQHGATVFRPGANISGVLSTAGVLTDDAARRLAQNWRDTYAGTHNAAKVAVLEQGLTFAPISMNNEEAQYLGTRAMSAREIASLYRVPLHKLGIEDSATLGGLEQAEIRYIRDGLQPIATRIEENANYDLLFDSEQQSLSIKFDFDELMRGDAPSRFGVYQTALLNGIYCLDDVLVREGMPPLPDGKGQTRRVPLNTGAIGSVNPEGAAAVTAPAEPPVVAPPNT